MARTIVCCFKPSIISYYSSVPADTLQFLANYGFDFIYCENQAEFLAHLPEAEIAIAADFKAEWINLAPKLKWVTTFMAGKERIAEAELLKKGIKVSFGRFHGKIMADTLIGMMLFTSRGLGTAYNLQKEKKWSDSILFDQVSLLRGKTCMILGMGSIGKHVARLTKFFGMYNIGVKRTVNNQLENIDKLITVDSFKNYLPRVDHLVMILPKDPSTNNIISTEELALMKKTACLYNIGRGNSIDEDALHIVLKEERLAWACLDVFQTEPLPVESQLWNLDNILILPHASAFTPEYFGVFFEEFMNDFEEYMGG